MSDWTKRARLTATPSDGGRVLHGTLNASNKTPQGKLDWLLASLTFQAKRAGIAFAVELVDPLTGRTETLTIGAL